MLKQISEDQLRKDLSAQQYAVLRQKATEPQFSGPLLHNHDTGMYSCGACGTELFSSEHKFDSGSGWPSFYQAAQDKKVILQTDGSAGMARTEVLCANCGSHLGHLFDDAPQTPTGQRYCINSAALTFHKSTPKKV